MHWIAVMAVGAAAGFVKKLVARHRRGNEIPMILEDPPDVRTLARFVLDEPTTPHDVLVGVATALAPELEARATEGAVRARPRGHAHEVDVLRLVDRGGRLHTLELTRAWTGAELDASARALLVRVHHVLLGHPAIRGLAWHARQDRALLAGQPFPITAPLLGDDSTALADHARRAELGRPARRRRW